MAIRIATVLGTRPETIKLFPVIRELDKSQDLESVVISTGQHREMIDSQLAFFGIRPDYDLNIIQRDQSPTDVCARAMTRLQKVFKEAEPGLVLVQGDTTTALAAAMTAFYAQVPVGHVEAGLRSRDPRHPFPEEGNRKLISALAELHFAPTRQSADNLQKEGVDRSAIYLTGNTIVDALLAILENRPKPDGGAGGQRRILVTAHRRESWGAPLEELCRALATLTERFNDVEVVYSVHLNPKVRNTVFPILEGRPRIRLEDPVSYPEFLDRMAEAYLIITDSGGIQEEAPTLSKPVLIFRETTERPEAVLCGGAKIVGRSRQRIVEEASLLLEDEQAYQAMAASGNPFGDGRAAQRIHQAILHHFGRGERPADLEQDFTQRRRDAEGAEALGAA